MCLQSPHLRVETTLVVHQFYFLTIVLRTLYAPVSQHTSALAAFVATSSRQAVDVILFMRTIIGGKRQGSQADLNRGIQKRQRRMDKLAEGVCLVWLIYAYIQHRMRM